MTSNQSRINILVFYTVVYIYIFNPVFKVLDFGLNVFLLLVSGIYAFTHLNLFKKYLKAYKHELWIIIFMMLYLSIGLLLNGLDNIVGVVRLQEMILTLLFIPFFLVETVISRFKDKGFLNMMITVGLIAATITLLCLIFPQFQNIIRGIQTNREIGVLESSDEFLLRGFGLGGNLTSAYGYIMGVCGAICLIKLKYSRSYYVFYVLLFVLAAAVNARTGMLAVVIAMAFMLMRNVKRFNIGYLLAACILIVLLLYGYQLLEVYFPYAYEFISDFVKFFSSTDNYKGSAYDNMLHFPRTLNGLVFGEGRDVFGIGTEETSDIGFVRDIYMGGIVFVTMLAMYLYILFKKMYRRSGDLILVLILAMSVMLFYYKGLVFYASHAVSRFIMLFYFVLVYNELHKNRIIVFKK